MDEALILADGLKKFGLDCGDDVVGKFQAYADLLIKWNRVYNLTAITRREEVLTHHYDPLRKGIEAECPQCS